MNNCGQGSQSRSDPVEAADVLSVTVGRGGTEREDLERIANTAASLLNELMGQFKPCMAKAKLKIRGDTSLPSLRQTTTVQAEGDLNLREDGTTETTLPVTLARVQQSGGCDREFTTAASGRLHVNGSYEPNDDALALRMRLSIDPPTGAWTCVAGPVHQQCTTGGGTITCTSTYMGISRTTSMPDPGADIDLTSGGAVMVALADGARATMARPAGWPEIWSWDATLNLEYGSAGTGVAVSQGAVALIAAP